jgi:hypothetical protein
MPASWIVVAPIEDGNRAIALERTRTNIASGKCGTSPQQSGHERIPPAPNTTVNRTRAFARPNTTVPEKKGSDQYTIDAD